MKAIPEGYVKIPLIDPTGDPERKPPVFGKVTGLDTMTLTLYLHRAREIQEATSEVPYALGAAASVFGLLHKITAAGFAPEKGELCGLYELCQRGLDAAADKEGEVLTSLNMILRVALGHYPKQEEAE